MTTLVTHEVSFDTVRDEQALAPLGEQWDELVRAAPRPSPFLLHGWLLEWWRHHRDGAELDVHLAYRGTQLVGALPTYVRHEGALRIASFLGGETSHFGDVLLARDEPESTAAALVRRLTESPRYDFALLHGLSGNSRLGGLETDLALVQRVEAPVLDLSPGWEAVYRSKTTSKKRNLHARRRRQLASLGRVETNVARKPDELARVVDETFRLHELRWAGRYDGSGYATPTGRRFHHAALLRLAELDVPRIVTLELDGRVIAFHYYFALCGRMFVHRLAFDPQYAACSPGVVNLLDALEIAADEGLERVEYLGGADRYKVELSDGFDPVYDGFGLAATMRGRVAAEALRRTLELRLRLKRSERLRAAYLRARARASL
jgi:CelD/BcsL family acetyltransferase involved in cellulose biosynthesis